MPITVRCPCGYELRARSDFAGRTVKCPGCKKPLVIPGGRRAASRESVSRARGRRPRRQPGRMPWGVVGGVTAAGALVAVAFVVVAPRRRPKGSGGPSGSARAGADPAPPQVTYSDANVGRWAAQLEAPQMSERAAAARTLAQMGPRARQAVPALLHAMKRRSQGIEVSAAIAKALKAIGPAAVPQLLAALHSGDKETRFYAARALGRLGVNAKDAVPALLAVLERDRHNDVRASAASALGEIGRAAAPASAALRKVAGNPNTPFSGDPGKDALRVAAQQALRKIRSSDR